MTVYSWLCLFGIPGLLGSFYALIRKQFNRIKTENAALKLGTQALLRDSMLRMYRYCASQGYASYDDREAYEGLFTAYIGLGGNGVMKDIHTKFGSLPTGREKANAEQV